MQIRVYICKLGCDSIRGDSKFVSSNRIMIRFDNFFESLESQVIRPGPSGYINENVYISIMFAPDNLVCMAREKSHLPECCMCLGSKTRH